MALSHNNRGSGADNTASTTLAVTPSGNFAAGELAVLFVSADNSGAGGVHCIVAATDTQGNTWTRRVAPLYDPGSANAGVQGAIFTTSMDGGVLTTSDTITVDFNGRSTTAKSWVLSAAIPGAGNTAEYVTGGEGTGSATNAPTVTTSSITSGNMVYGAGFVEAGTETTWTADSDTTNGSWGSGSSQSVGSTTSGNGITRQHKITTGTGTQTFNPTLSASRDVILAWIEVKEQAAAQTLGAMALLGGAQVFAPTVVPGAVAVSPALLGGAQVFSPTIVPGAVVVTPALLGGAQVFAPTIVAGAVTVTPALLGGAQVFAPTLVLAGSTVQPDLLGGAQVFAPTVVPGAVSIAPALLGGAQVFTPTVSPGAVTLAPALLGGAQVFAPTLLPGAISVSPALLGGATVFAPTLTQGLSVAPALLGGAQVFAPVIAPGAVSISPALLGGAVLFDPLVLVNQPGTVVVTVSGDEAAVIAAGLHRAIVTIGNVHHVEVSVE